MACSGGRCVSSTLQGTGQGAATGGSLGGGWGALIGGILGGGAGLASSFLNSGGSSSSQMVDALAKYYKPTRLGWSWADLENQVAFQQYQKQLDASAAVDLALSKSMNKQLPTAQVEGLRAAGLNPILAVLGSGFSPIQASASAGGSVGGSKVPTGFTKPMRRVNSAGSALDFARILTGAVDAEVDNRRADTDNKAADTQNKEALTGNIKSQTDLIHAQADKVRAEADGIRDKIEHGSSWMSDLGREIRSGISKPVENFVEGALKLFGYGDQSSVNPSANSDKHGNSAKQPSLTIELNPQKGSKSSESRYDHKSRYINEYNWKGE